MRLGIGSYTYGWATGAYGFSDPSVPTLTNPMDAHAIIREAEKLGVTCVQICFRPALHELNDAELDAIAEHARESGQTLEIGTSGGDEEHLRRYAEIAGQLGAVLVRTILPGASAGLKDERRVIERVLPAYERARTILAVENHEDYASSDLAGLIRSIGSPHLGVCLDTVNSLGRGEGFREVVDTLMPLTASVHVKDFTTRRRPSGMGFEVTGAPAGTGRLDVRGLLRRTAEERPEASVILEQWSDFRDTLEESIAEQDRTARAGVTHLRELIAGL